MSASEGLHSQDELARLAKQARLVHLAQRSVSWQQDLAAMVSTLDALERQPAATAADHARPSSLTGSGHRGTLTMRLSQLRADVVAPSLTVAQALSNAPEPMGDGFGVPPVLAGKRSG